MWPFATKQRYLFLLLGICSAILPEVRSSADSNNVDDSHEIWEGLEEFLELFNASVPEQGYSYGSWDEGSQDMPKTPVEFVTIIGQQEGGGGLEILLRHMLEATKTIGKAKEHPEMDPQDASSTMAPPVVVPATPGGKIEDDGGDRTEAQSGSQETLLTYASAMVKSPGGAHKAESNRGSDGGVHELSDRVSGEDGRESSEESSEEKDTDHRRRKGHPSKAKSDQAPGTPPPHPLIFDIYKEVESETHTKLDHVKYGVPTIVGLEPYQMTIDGRDILMLFNTTVVNWAKHIQHVDLVLSPDGDNRNKLHGHLEVEVTVVSPDHQHPGNGPKVVISQDYSSRHRQNFKEKDGHNAVVELGPDIQHWWKDGLLMPNSHLQIKVSGKGRRRLSVNRPILLFYYLPDHNDQKKDRNSLRISRLLSRKGRSIRHYPFAPEGPCTLTEWSVTLQELGWEGTVVGPSEFVVNYCSGPCHPPNATVDSIDNAGVRSLMMGKVPHKGWKKVPPPYCVPTKTRAAVFIYRGIDPNQYVIKKMDNMVAEECGCR